MAQVIVYECTVCAERARRPAEIPHMRWCLPLAHLDAQGDLVYEARSHATVRIPRIRCIHGRDVSLSAHECPDCSQSIAERRCPEM